MKLVFGECPMTRCEYHHNRTDGFRFRNEIDLGVGGPCVPCGVHFPPWFVGEIPVSVP